MALKQHKDVSVRFQQQVDNSATYILPFIQQTRNIAPGINVLEIGCGEGGVLRPFIDMGCYCVGVDLASLRIDYANDVFKKEVAEGKVQFLFENIYDENFLQKFRGFFDIVILKDVIEHIPEQEKFIPYLRNFLKTGGQIFFGFPPWYMPFGGHQQVAQGKLASKLPYYHILPKALYRGMLKMMGETDGLIKDLMEIYDTRISIERFERIVKASGYKVLNKQHYLFNPIYKYKFGVQPRKQWKPVTGVPFVRNFITTCVYYTIG